MRSGNEYQEWKADSGREYHPIGQNGSRPPPARCNPQDPLGGARGLRGSACPARRFMNREGWGRVPRHARSPRHPGARAPACGTRPGVGVRLEQGTPMIGRRLDHYVILERIGEGMEGEVYRARDERLHRDVAIKVLPSGLLTDEKARRRLRSGALALSQVNHPNIATIHDLDRVGEVDFLVMELVPGQSLDQMLLAGPLAETEIRRLAAQLAEGLAAAHGQHVVHRDLKPANLRVTPDGRLKILDFGLSRLTRPLPGVSVTTTQAAGEIAGTYQYMAPEVMQGGSADARSDLFSVGVILYEMGTGRPPFTAGSVPELFYATVNQAPAPPRSLNPALSPALETVILNALEKNPHRRTASAEALKRDLEQAEPRRVVRRRRAWPPVLAAAATLIALLGLVFALDAARMISRLQSLFGDHGVRGIQALAVLPIENLSGDSEDEYFADGMTEELISELARIRAIRVIARSSVMAYRGTGRSPHEMGRALKVDAIIAGRVLRQSNRVRLSAEMIRCGNDQTLWAQSFEGDLRDVLTMQRSLSRAIVEKIRRPLDPEERTRLAAAQPVVPEAHTAYLKGRFFWAKYDEEGFRKAQEYFNQAIEIDPTYAAAYAGLADAWYGPSNLYLAPNVAIPRARAAAIKALSLDSTLAEAHVSFGIVKSVYDWDWAGAEHEFQRALQLKPNDAMARYWHGHFLVAMGRFAEGLAETRHALELDPLSAFLSASLGFQLCLARRYAESAEALQNALAMDPQFGLATGFLGLTREQQGDYAGSIANSVNGVGADGLGQLGHVYAVAGRRDEALKVLAGLLQRSKTSFVPAYTIARIHAGLGDKDQAFQWLDRAVEDHSELLMFLLVDPEIDNLRSDPRMDGLLARVGLKKRS